MPSLSNRIKRANDVTRSDEAFITGCAHENSMFETNDGTTKMSIGPSPVTW